MLRKYCYSKKEPSTVYSEHVPDDQVLFGIPREIMTPSQTGTTLKVRIVIDWDSACKADCLLGLFPLPGGCPLNSCDIRMWRWRFKFFPEAATPGLSGDGYFTDFNGAWLDHLVPVIVDDRKGFFSHDTGSGNNAAFDTIHIQNVWYRLPDDDTRREFYPENRELYPWVSDHLEEPSESIIDLYEEGIAGEQGWKTCMGSVVVDGTSNCRRPTPTPTPTPMAVPPCADCPPPAFSGDGRKGIHPGGLPLVVDATDIDQDPSCRCPTITTRIVPRFH